MSSLLKGTSHTMSKRLDNKWDRRDKKRHKQRHGMKITGRSVFILDDLIKKKSREAEEKKNE